MSIGTALVLIFCTPLGWVGLFIFAIAVAICLDAFQNMVQP